MPASPWRHHSYLSNCEFSRQELTGMRDLSQLIGALAAGPEEFVPAPGFYARVMRKVGDRHAVPSFAGLFALDFAFGRRLAFSSLLTLAVLGTYLVSREGDYPTGLRSEAVMAQQDSPAFDSARAQENMLATLTTYEP